MFEAGFAQTGSFSTHAANSSIVPLRTENASKPPVGSSKWSVTKNASAPSAHAARSSTVLFPTMSTSAPERPAAAMLSAK